MCLINSREVQDLHSLAKAAEVGGHGAGFVFSLEEHIEDGYA